MSQPESLEARNTASGSEVADLANAPKLHLRLECRLEIGGDNACRACFVCREMLWFSWLKFPKIPRLITVSDSSISLLSWQRQELLNSDYASSIRSLARKSALIMVVAIGFTPLNR